MIQYLYLNQIHDYTKGKLGAQQILHAAANGSIQLYAHTPDLADYGSRLSPISEKACPLVEMVYNTHCSYGEPEEFTGSEFLVAGEITKDMQEGREPFSYSLHKSHWDPDVARTQIFEAQDDTAKPTKIIVKVTGSDFVVLKDDLVTLLNNTSEAPATTANNHEHMTEDLSILNTAWQRYWKNADRMDKSSWHTNEEVEGWLIESGFSKKNASAGATIIKPEWARKGGRR